MKSTQNSEAANLKSRFGNCNFPVKVGKFPNAKSKIRERNPKGDAEGNRVKPTQPTQKFSIDKPVGCYASQLWLVPPVVLFCSAIYPTSRPIFASIHEGRERPIICSAKAWDATFSVVRMIFRVDSDQL